MNDKLNANKKCTLWNWVKALCSIIVVVVISYKFITIEITTTIDFPTLLSILLALFSVALSALFYFKATETSNRFYDNTYKFTKDISQLLVKIESGFGEKLNNLNESYASITNSLNNYKKIPIDLVNNTEEEIKAKNIELETLVKKRNEYIERLIITSNLEEKEKNDLSEKLKESEINLMSAQKEISKLNNELSLEKVNKTRVENIYIDFNKEYVEYTRNRVLKHMSNDFVVKNSISSVMEKFNNLASNYPNAYFNELKLEGYFHKNTLTKEGANFLKALAKYDLT